MFEVTLTFDNGPDAQTTPSVLDSLERHGVHAYFFVLGRNLADPALRRLAERAAQAGHRIANHTYSHTIPFGELSRAEDAVDEIRRTEALIGPLAGQPKLFRPFGKGGQIGPHLLNRAALDHLRTEKYTMALWTSVPGDWKDPEGWMDKAVSDCTGAKQSVVVLHDLPTGAMAHLDRFLTTIADAGGTFVLDLPAAVTPIRNGIAHGDIAGMMPRDAA